MTSLKNKWYYPVITKHARSNFIKIFQLHQNPMLHVNSKTTTYQKNIVVNLPIQINKTELRMIAFIMF